MILTVVDNCRKEIIQRMQGETIMDSLIRAGFLTSAVCGGKGKCGKCRIQFLENAPQPHPEEEKLFTAGELQDGWRLACLAKDEMDAVIRIRKGNDEEQFEVVDTFAMERRTDFGEKQENRMAEPEENAQENSYAAAIDIGTTTLAFVLWKNHQIIARSAGINHQRMYGADVISRIQASTEGKNEHLRQLIREDLKEGISHLAKQAQISPEQIKTIIISGNTTMGHLLMGYDCKSLGIVPFTPVNIDYIRGSAKEILDMESDAEVLLLPGISTFVGADIVSGLYACKIDQRDELCLLIDLGTNGEMALGNKERILVTSTAAGPVFEGGNIKWGTGSVEGAINSVKITEEGAQVTTIGGAKPVGLCGTGVIETAAGLYELELMDENGRLEDPYFEEGYPLAQTEEGETIVFTQKDVRELQLAKSAIRAGLETLLLRYGVEKEDVSKVYIAGGFGFQLNLEKAISIGMLPGEFAGKMETIGNSSLAGAVSYLEDPLSEQKIDQICAASTEIPLSGDKDFNQLYMEYMFFGDDDF